MEKNETYKIFITHGIFSYSLFKHNIYVRNTTKYLPIPLTFRELLEKTYLYCWHIKRTIRRFKKNIRIEGYAKIPVEFTIAHIPQIHLMVITIVHPLNPFRRKSGSKIIKQRIEWALNHPSEKREWIHRLEE